MGGACSREPSNVTKPPGSVPGAQQGAAARHFQTIRDRFETIDEVQAALRKAGLESSDLILAIDLTKSNDYSGKESFNGVPLIHELGWLYRW
jgi:E3 ubiquitin-protein ligase RGLG